MIRAAFFPFLEPYVVYFDSFNAQKMPVTHLNPDFMNYHYSNAQKMQKFNFSTKKGLEFHSTVSFWGLLYKLGVVKFESQRTFDVANLVVVEVSIWVEIWFLNAPTKICTMGIWFNHFHLFLAPNISVCWWLDRWKLEHQNLQVPAPRRGLRWRMQLWRWQCRGNCQEGWPELSVERTKDLKVWGWTWVQLGDLK